MRQTAPLLHPIGEGWSIAPPVWRKRRRRAKKRCSVAYYILYILHVLTFCHITLFSLLHSFSTHYIHCHFVTFCCSILYIILLVSFLVSLLKNTTFCRCFSILHRIFLFVSKKVHFLFYSVSIHYNALTFFNRHFCSLFGKRLYICSKVNR